MNRLHLQVVIQVLHAISFAQAVAGHEVSLASPDETNRITVQSDEGGHVEFSIERGGRQVILPSKIDVKLTGIGSITDGSHIPESNQRIVDEVSPLLWGKANQIRDHYRAVQLRLTGTSGIEWDFELRAYDDGIAFRYGIPKQEKLEKVSIEGENIEFRLAGDPSVLYMTCDNFTTSHEATYDRKPLAALPVKKLIDKPITAVWSHGTAACITEARLRDFAGMYLERPSPISTAIRTRLSPLPGKKNLVVAHDAPIWSPWRVVLLADKAGQLVESNTLLCLNDPPQGDFNWLVPGKTTFHWWNGAVEHSKESTPESNFAIHKEYIDFCAKHGIEYHSVISVSGNRPWFVQRDAGFAAPHPDSNILIPRPDIDLPRILEYANVKGVGIRFWVHWKPLSEHLEEAFTQYEKWGIRGLMVDFMDRDDQEMIEWQEECLQAAARHKLHIQFHGSHKPTGEQRTYPNLFNREGVLNLEYLKWTDLCTPAHAVNVAYTRLFSGPVDFHLGGFHSVTREEFKWRDLRPWIMGTRCNQLALYVIFENPMPMLADVPSAYEGQPGFEFLVEVPTTWDETRFIAGEMGEYLVLARRKGDVWYLGGITNWDERKLSLPLKFLGDGKFKVTHYADVDAAKPNELIKAIRNVTAADSIEVELVSGGGVVAVFRRE